ncbi:MAG: D-alanyl-D-alanine carboxypeptidase [Clostridiales bacterium]
MEGVSTLSGYLTTATGNVLCFSIMNQGVRYSSTGRNFQDRVCRALCR